MKTFVIEAGRSVPARVRLFWCLATLLLTMFAAASAAAGSQTTQIPSKLNAGIWLSRENDYLVSKQHQEELLLNLRQITGLCELRIKEDGSLSLGDTIGSSNGSFASRQVLLRAINSGYVFFIEDHTGSSDVNFGQLYECTIYEDEITGSRFLIWRIRLDFEDFRKMSAPDKVRESFSIGFTFLHELLHGLGHKDAQQIRDLGECEEQINMVRMELNLPTRDQYFAEQLKITQQFFTMRLRFRDHVKQRNQYLFFMAAPGSKIVEIVEGVVTVGRPPR